MKIKCCRCNQDVLESNTKIDEWLQGSSCKACRLKLEILSSPSLSIGVDLSTGETFGLKLLWNEKISKVLAETDTSFNN